MCPSASLLRGRESNPYRADYGPAMLPLQHPATTIQLSRPGDFTFTGPPAKHLSRLYLLLVS